MSLSGTCLAIQLLGHRASRIRIGEQRLWEAGYLAKLQDYKPEDLVKTVKAVGH